jgi:Tol biopolymer transport system component/DNA-binding winged helix-turn-helix (wHTH) protein
MLLGSQSASMNAALRIRTDANRFLAVGEHVVDIDTLRLLTRTDGTRLTPKAAAVLLQLVRAAGRTLSRDELLNEVWKGTCPTPDVLTQAVKDLRRALGDDLNAPRYVETLPRLGYRLVASARFVDHFDAEHPPSTTEELVTPADALVGTVVGVLNKRRVLLSTLVALLGVAALLAASALALRRETAGDVDAAPRWRASEQRSVTADPGPESFPHISPDGTRVAYSIGDADAQDTHIVQRSLEQSRVMRLAEPVPGEEFYPVWSPDGAEIAFARYNGDQCRIVSAPALGGPERLIDVCANRAMNYFSWAPDGKHLLTTIPSSPQANDLAITLVSTEGGAVEKFPYEHSAIDLDLDARYSPDGRQIAFRRGGNPYSDLFVVGAGGGAVRQVTHLASRMRGFDWTRDGSALVFSSGHAGPQALYTVSIDDGHIDALGVQPAEFPSAARATDTVVYEIPRVRTQLAMIALDGAQELRRDLVPSTGSDSAPAFSPVDGRLAFVSDRSGSQQLWLYDPATAETFPLTEVTEPTLRYPIWRPDGARILMTTRNETGGGLIEIDLATRAIHVVTSPGDDVRYGVYGPKPDTFITVVGGTKREAVELDHPGTPQASRRVLAHDVGRTDYDRASATVYFTKIGEEGLFKFDPQTGAESVVTKEVNPAHLDGWLVLEGQIYYIAPVAVGPSVMHVLDPSSGSDRVVATIPDSVADFNFSVSHDGQHIVVVRAAAQDTDVGAVTVRREGAAR